MHFLRAINVLQRLIEKYLKEAKKITSVNKNQNELVTTFIAENVLSQFFNMIKVL